MKRKRILLLLLVAALLCLAACGREEPVTNENAPGRMVRRIEVAIHPEDDSFDRVYVTQENMNELLTLLRAMSSKDYLQTEPDMGQTYYTATVTFANGEQSVYCLLGHSYLRIGKEPWCRIDRELSFRFTEFLRTHPSDDGSVPMDTTAPTQ